MKSFSFNGRATDWIGFQFEHKGETLTVDSGDVFADFHLVDENGKPRGSITYTDLLEEYINQLEERISDAWNAAVERGERQD